MPGGPSGSVGVGGDGISGRIFGADDDISGFKPGSVWIVEIYFIGNDMSKHYS
ncbi:hypothetical protein Hdeb2414_s0011g00359621 [Helianthus debilis subsp. tardiflorus]